MAVELTQDMKDLLGAQLAFLSTADEDGEPQVGPKGSMRVFDDSHLIYNEFTGKQALRNLQDTGGRVAVAVVDREKLHGYRFEGIAHPHKDDDIFNEAYK